MADNLRHLSELRLHPSYSSVEDFIRECRKTSGDRANKRALMNVDAEYEARIDQFSQKLGDWRAVRESSALGTQAYDKAALTRVSFPSSYFSRLSPDPCSGPFLVLSWIWTSLSEFRISTAFPFITKLLKELFAMQELLDNTVSLLPL